MSLLEKNCVKINNAYKTSVHKYEGGLGKPVGKVRFRLNDYINSYPANVENRVSS
jgi:hypothetical protein